MPALRLSFAWAVAALDAFVAWMCGAGFGIATACFAGGRLRRGWFCFGRWDPVVEVN
jgi:hypothetical protein